MARIRSLKPEFWDDRKLARATSRDARLLYMGMWNQADEHSRLNGDEQWLKGRVFPFEDDIQSADVATLLDELEVASRIVRYEVDGDPFIYLPKLGDHQRLEPAKVDSRHPAPPFDPDDTPGAGQSEPDADPDAHESARRADKSAPDANESALLYVTGSMDQVAGSMGRGAPRGSRGTRLPDDWTPSDSAKSWTLERIDTQTAAVELEKFRNHWHAKAGGGAVKVDWDATWRNWVLNAQSFNASRGRASPSRGSTADQRVQDGLTLASELRREEAATRKELPA